MGKHRENGAGAPGGEPLEPAEPMELSPSIRGLLERFTELDGDATLDRAALARRQPTASELKRQSKSGAQRR